MTNKPTTENASAFLANASARLFFGVNDNETANYVATMLGHTPAESSSSSVSLNGAGWDTRSRSHSHSEGNYWLLDAAEIQRLPLTKVIVKLRNCPFPIFGKLHYSFTMYSCVYQPFIVTLHSRKRFTPIISSELHNPGGKGCCIL